MPLLAFRFRYDEILEPVLAGQHRLLVSSPTGPFETGRHVRKVQQALLDAGFALPEHGADSVYGPETADAVVLFKTEQHIFPNDGVVGVNTMKTLDAIFVDEVPFPPPPHQPGDLSVDDVLEAIQGAESANPGETAEAILTMIRQLYYPGTDPDGLTFREVAFDHLLPDAPFRRPDGSRRILTPAGMEPIFFGRLVQRAPENPTPGRPLDNPSPYLVDATAERVDLGHVLLTMDAMAHGRADEPYVTFGVPAIDPASWVADLGIGAVWTEQDGQPDAPVVLPYLADGRVDFDGYFHMSAPDADLLGDIDGFNIARSWLQGTPLSSALIAYYLDRDVPGGYRHRFRMFMGGLFGTTDPDEAALTAAMSQWIPRVDRFNDLFAAGSDAILVFTPPPLRQWQFTHDVIAQFFQWLLDHRRTEEDRFD
ncbi:peptidoglycan-binding protein [Streptomyces sp. NPDC047737]|uniref:peptidoglycan-binding domain-containing protein n=1 Tax=Streptomyces sp. NPDC047737 TaxID=3155740 RepID=UPI0033C557CB